MCDQTNCNLCFTLSSVIDKKGPFNSIFDLFDSLCYLAIFVQCRTRGLKLKEKIEEVEAVEEELERVFNKTKPFIRK